MEQVVQARIKMLEKVWIERFGMIGFRWMDWIIGWLIMSGLVDGLPSLEHIVVFLFLAWLML